MSKILLGQNFAPKKAIMSFSTPPASVLSCSAWLRLLAVLGILTALWLLVGNMG